jgi:hypothetical protein
MGGMSVSRNYSSGGFAASLNYPVPSITSVVTLGDLNGDGENDIVVGTDKGVSVFLNSSH